LGEIVIGTQICNLFGKNRPPTSIEIKKNHVVVCKKNPENLQILKLQYLDFPDSVLDDLFFQLGCFSEMNSNIQPVSTKYSHKYAENFWNVAAHIFSQKKKLQK
jgi:hypothetical protein